MMFKKGSFEIGATVYPVAIKVLVLKLLFVMDRFIFNYILLTSIDYSF